MDESGKTKSIQMVLQKSDGREGRRLEAKRDYIFQGNLLNNTLFVYVKNVHIYTAVVSEHKPLC